MDNITIHNYTEPRLALGTIGAAVAGVVGMLGWFAVVKITGYEIGYAAWGIGLLVGYGTKLLAKGGNVVLGVAAAICAFLAIVGGQYIVVAVTVDETVKQLARQSYESRMAFAQEAVQAGDDAQVRAILAKYDSEGGEARTPDQYSDEVVAKFREEELRALKEFIDGKPSRAEHEAVVAALLTSGISKSAVFKESLSAWTLLWLFLGVGSAYKLAAAGAAAAASTSAPPQSPAAS
jgi:hypothetical protein